MRVAAAGSRRETARVSPKSRCELTGKGLKKSSNQCMSDHSSPCMAAVAAGRWFSHESGEFDDTLRIEKYLPRKEGQGHSTEKYGSDCGGLFRRDPSSVDKAHKPIVRK